MQITDIKDSTILILDDNPENIQVLGKHLKAEGFNVEFAIEGRSALDWISKETVDLVLLDIKMPGMNGYEVCEEIRSNPDLKNLPVIFITAEYGRESIIKGFDAGAQDYVTKPFDSRELIVRVRTHLKLKKSLEELETLNQSLEQKVIERTNQLSAANERLESINQELAKLDKAKTDFLKLISHEIRTPLNGIIGPLQLIKERGSYDEIAVLISILDKSVMRLEKFSYNALLITNLRLSDRSYKKTDIQLKKTLQELLRDFESEISEKELLVDMKIEPENISFPGNYELFKRCFFNLIDNAVKFSPRNSHIGISLFENEYCVCCEFRDHGKGFPQKIIDEPFEPFVNDERLADNSIGIGLPVVKMIMDVIEGNITLSNHPDGGAVVKLIFNKNFASKVAVK